MQDIADNQYPPSADRAPTLGQGETVEQGLGRVFMHAVAGIDHGQTGRIGEEFRRPGRRMAHNENIRPHRRQGACRIRQALALRCRGRGHGEIDDIGAEPLARHLETALGARRGLEEEIEHGQPAQLG